MANQPFAIWIASADGSEARERWHSPGDDGFFAQYYPRRPLRWTAQDRLLFYSEHEDWLHIYGLDPDGGDPVDLTPGECIAEHSTLADEGRTLFFSANCGDIDRRHIWRVSTGGGEPEPVTRGEGIETHPRLVGDGWLAYRAADARRPTAITVAATDGTDQRRIAPKGLPGPFPADALVVPEPVVFEAADGVEVHGQLFLPPHGNEGDKHPALVFMHGGPIRQMLLGWHYRGYYARAYAMNQYLASRGYAVLAVNYRAGIGYGRDFRLAGKQGPRGSSEYRDILAAGLFLRRHSRVDGERIGLWGGSYGGLLTAMGLARDSDLFAAGVDFHGVHDWAFRATDLLPGGAWGIDGEAALRRARESSPVSYLDTWSSPILFIHGDDDRNVLFAQTTDLVQRLRERDVHTEVLVFPDEVHGFLRHANWLRAYRETSAFFDRHLQAD